MLLLDILVFMKISGSALSRYYAKAAYECYGPDLVHKFEAILFLHDVDKSFPSNYPYYLIPNISRILESFAIDISRIFHLMVKNKRSNLFIQVCRHFVEICDKKSGIIRALVTTKHHISEQQINYISDKLKYFYSAEKVIISNVIDPKIYGGVSVKVNNDLFDFSLKKKLTLVSKYLKSVLMEV